MPQLTLKRSSMSAVRMDCSGSGSKLMASLRAPLLSSGLGERELGSGHGGIGLGSFHLCSIWGMGSVAGHVMDRRMLTRNSRSFAVGVMIFTSWAVDALCIAFGPGAAKDTLPTRTFWQTVRDYGR